MLLLWRPPNTIINSTPSVRWYLATHTHTPIRTNPLVLTPLNHTTADICRWRFDMSNQIWRQQQKHQSKCADSTSWRCARVLAVPLLTFSPLIVLFFWFFCLSAECVRYWFLCVLIVVQQKVVVVSLVCLWQQHLFILFPFIVAFMLLSNQLDSFTCSTT